MTVCEGAASHITIKTLPVVRVSMAFDVPAGGFFEEDAFVSNVAALLGIDMARIRIVSVIAGRRDGRRSGGGVDMEIGECASPVPEFV